jgi:hypothetical protein
MNLASLGEPSAFETRKAGSVERHQGLEPDHTQG